MVENIAAIGIILFLAVIGGRVAAYFKLPMVTGYMITGIILGKSYLNIVNVEILKDLQILADIAIGFIIFSIGGIFHFDHIKKNWKKILTFSIYETMMTFFLVLIFCFIYSIFFELSIIAVIFLAIISISTAPAATVMVMREYDPEGPLTNYLYTLLGLNNFISIFLFSIANVAMLYFFKDGSEVTFGWLPMYIKPLWFIFGSVVVGIIMGLILAYFEHYEKNSNQILVYVLAAILISIVLSQKFELSFLIINLFMGITVINVTSQSESMFEILKNSDPPLYAIFFVLAGAKFDVAVLKSIGILGIGYLVMRAVGKILGTYLAARKLDEQPAIKKYMGLALLPQAGLALSLGHIISVEFGAIGEKIFTLIIATSIIYETVGPIFTKEALFRSGEVKMGYIVNVNSFSKLGSKSKSFLHHLVHRFNLLSGVEKVQTHAIVKNEMIEDVDLLKENTPYKEIVRFLAKAPYNYLPVVDKENNYIGVVTSDVIKELLFNDEMNNLIVARDMVEQTISTVVPETLLVEALRKFNRPSIQYLIVLENENSRKMVGILDKTDVIDMCKKIREKKIFKG